MLTAGISIYFLIYRNALYNNLNNNRINIYFIIIDTISVLLAYTCCFLFENEDTIFAYWGNLKLSCDVLKFIFATILLIPNGTVSKGIDVNIKYELKYGKIPI
jgi:hypothetical protein